MSGVERIAKERKRQIGEEGWSEAHDDEHDRGELSMAAAAYARVASAQARGASGKEFSVGMMVSNGEWPWDESWWKPSGVALRNLEKAGALIAAEIDRLERAVTRNR